MAKVVSGLVAAAALIALLSWYGTRESRGPHTARRILKVCADPNNLPFSNERGEGFENQIAALAARELDADLEYFWWAQHRGFIRQTLGSGKCDVLMGVASASDRVLTTTPYYRSAWVFVSRADRRLDVRSFDSPALRQLRIGVHLVGDDGANTPPVHALERRHMAANLVGFQLTGDYSRPDPPSELLQAVICGEVDIAVAWGPLAGYFAKLQQVRLKLTPVSPAVDSPGVPMTYEISAGVRKQDRVLRQEIEGVFERRRTDLQHILDTFGVPRVDENGLLVP